MNYFIGGRYLGGPNAEISDEEYHEVESAREVLVHLWDIEETFAILAQSYKDLERCLFEVSLDYRLNDGSSEGTFDTYREQVNLKLLTFLIAGGVHTEKLTRKASSAGLQGFSEEVRQQIVNAAFDRSFEYRVVSALRNHAVHQKLPLGGLSLALANLSPSGDLHEDAVSRSRTTFNPYLIADDLVNNKSLRSATREEIRATGCASLDLKYFVRGYVHEITECQIKIREATEDAFSSGCGVYSKYRAKIEELFGRVTDFPSVWKSEGKGLSDEISIADSFPIKLGRSRQSWVRLKHVQRTYLSTEIVKSNDKFPFEHSTLWIPK